MKLSIIHPANLQDLRAAQKLAEAANTFESGNPTAGEWARAEEMDLHLERLFRLHAKELLDTAEAYHTILKLISESTS